MYIEIKDLEKKIRGITILKNINVKLNGGKIYGLWGKNGCGKTMLMRCICGLILPTNGTIDINGEYLGRKLEFPKSIGVLIENPAFLPDYTGLKNLEILASLKGIIEQEKIRKTIKMVGLNPEDKRKYKKYSLGMKQRLGIAAAIMEESEIIILDEPINAIDESGVKEIREVLLSLKDENRIIIVACHDRGEVNLLSDEIFIMEEGTIVRKEM